MTLRFLCINLSFCNNELSGLNIQYWIYTIGCEGKGLEASSCTLLVKPIDLKKRGSFEESTRNYCDTFNFPRPKGQIRQGVSSQVAKCYTFRQLRIWLKFAGCGLANKCAPLKFEDRTTIDRIDQEAGNMDMGHGRRANVNRRRWKRMAKKGSSIHSNYSTASKQNFTLANTSANTNTNTSTKTNSTAANTTPSGKKDIQTQTSGSFDPWSASKCQFWTS